MLRKILLAGAAIGLMMGSALAQFPMPSISLGGDKPPPTPEQVERQKALDNAYNTATKKIPDKKATADPWGNVRSSPAPTPKANQ